MAEASRSFTVVRANVPGARGVRYTVTRSTAPGESVTTTYELTALPPLLERGWSPLGVGAGGSLGAPSSSRTQGWFGGTDWFGSSLGNLGAPGGPRVNSMPITWEQLYLASWFFPRQMAGWFAPGARHHDRDFDHDRDFEQERDFDHAPREPRRR